MRKWEPNFEGGESLQKAPGVVSFTPVRGPPKRKDPKNRSLRSTENKEHQVVRKVKGQPRKNVASVSGGRPEVRLHGKLY